MVGAHAMKRIPRIKFPQRHPKPAGSASKQEAISSTENVPQSFFSSRSPANMSVGGKASDQPKRTPVSQDEIDAILLGGTF